MQADAERTMNNLHVLGALSQNDKLLTNDDTFDIYTPTTMRALMRAWYGERRTQNIQRVKHTIRSAVAFANKSLEDVTCMMNSSSPSSDTWTRSDSQQLRIDTTAKQHFRMCDALMKARAGMANLVQTYRDDATATSQINVLLQEIDDFKDIMAPHTEQLRALIKRPAAQSARREGNEVVPCAVPTEGHTEGQLDQGSASRPTGGPGLRSGDLRSPVALRAAPAGGQVIPLLHLGEALSPISTTRDTSMLRRHEDEQRVGTVVQ